LFLLWPLRGLVFIGKNPMVTIGWITIFPENTSNAGENSSAVFFA